MEVGEAGAGRIFTESYDVKVEGGLMGKRGESKPNSENLPTDTHPIL
jgi:hypothetical protein|tara:strand:- start:800 stop:940 length:141 start_codon:yes stop_codon:yes gene_type:complete